MKMLSFQVEAPSLDSQRPRVIECIRQPFMMVEIENDQDNILRAALENEHRSPYLSAQPMYLQLVAKLRDLCLGSIHDRRIQQADLLHATHYSPAQWALERARLERAFSHYRNAKKPSSHTPLKPAELELIAQLRSGDIVVWEENMGGS